MANPKKISIIITIGAISIAAVIGFLYLSESMSIPESTDRHHFQVIVNDTFGIGEKRNSVGP